MNMDDVFQTMNNFELELERFNDHLGKSFDDLDKHHERVRPLWNDNMKRQYDTRWIEMENAMKDYITRDGQNYTEVLRDKLRAIKLYLFGY